MILQKLVVGPIASNCYIVGSESDGEGMIIDPGDEAGTISKKIGELELSIKLIVLTHGHIDHIGALKEIRDITSAEVAIHADDSRFLQGLAGTVTNFTYPALPNPDQLLKGGDGIDVGNLHLTVLHTPGHTPGGICLLGHGVVFTGDTLFNYGIGRTDLSGGSYRQLMNSIHTKLMVLPDDTIVCPGHGPDTTIGAERRANPFLK